MILLLAPLLLALGAAQDERESLAFRVLDENTTSGFQSGMEKFVSTTEDWIAIWAERQGNLKTKVPRPRVDFDRQVVVAVAMGRKDTEGYSVEITRVERTKDDIRIYLKKKAPREGANLPPKPTSPFVLARMPKPDLPVVFLDEERKK